MPPCRYQQRRAGGGPVSIPGSGIIRNEQNKHRTKGQGNMETLETLQAMFKVGQKYTSYSIDSMMAMTHRREFSVKQILPSGTIVIVERGKRKETGLRLKWQGYVNGPWEFYKHGLFIGWDQPIKCDTDQRSGVMRGNACYNLIGTPEAVRAWIDAGQINPLFDKASVLAIEGDKETVVYPELVREGDHAVIDRIMAEAV
jgi:hypothetical protein